MDTVTGRNVMMCDKLTDNTLRVGTSCRSKGVRSGNKIPRVEGNTFKIKQEINNI